MLNLIQKAKKDVVNKNLNYLKHSHIPIEHSIIKDEKGRLVGHFERNQVLNLHQHENLEIHTPKTTFSTALAGQTVKIDIPNSAGSYVDELILHLLLTNATGAMSQVCEAGYLFESIDIESDRGQIIQRIYDFDLQFANSNMVSRDEFDEYATYLNTNKKYQNNLISTQIANLGTKDFYINLHSLFNQAKIYLPALNDKFTITLNFRQSGLTLISGASCTLTTCEFIVLSRKVDTNINNHLIDEYKKRRHDFRLLTTQRFTDTLTMNASNKYTRKLSGITGLVSNLYFVIQDATTMTGATLTDFIKIATFELLDNNNRPIISSNPITDVENRYIMSKRFFPGQLCQRKNVYFIPFAQFPVDVFQTAKNSGYYPFDGDQSLSITTNATGAAETAEVQTLSPTISTTGVLEEPTGGSCCVRYKDSTSVPLAFNANAATILAAINNLQSVKDDNIVVSNGATILTTVGGLVLTISNLFEIPSANGGTFEICNSTLYDGVPNFLSTTCVITTTGVVKSSHVNGSYQLTVYTSEYDSIHVLKGQIAL